MPRFATSPAHTGFRGPAWCTATSVLPSACQLRSPSGSESKCRWGWVLVGVSVAVGVSVGVGVIVRVRVGVDVCGGVAVGVGVGVATAPFTRVNESKTLPLLSMACVVNVVLLVSRTETYEYRAKLQ